MAESLREYAFARRRVVDLIRSPAFSNAARLKLAYAYSTRGLHGGGVTVPFEGDGSLSRPSLPRERLGDAARDVPLRRARRNRREAPLPRATPGGPPCRSRRHAGRRILH